MSSLTDFVCPLFLLIYLDMPRTKSYRRSQAAARRLAERQDIDITPCWPAADDDARKLQLYVTFLLKLMYLF